MPNGAVSVSPSSTTTSSAGMPSSWATIWAQVVSWPWPCVRAPVRTMALPVMCTLRSAESNILMPRMSYSRLLPAPSGSVMVEKARPSSLPPFRALGSSAPEHLVVDRHEPYVQALGVLAGVKQEAERGAVREVLVPDEVHPAERGLVHAQVVGGRLHHPFLEEHRLGHPDRAPVGHSAGGFVGVQAARGQVRDRDV